MIVLWGNQHLGTQKNKNKDVGSIVYNTKTNWGTQRTWVQMEQTTMTVLGHVTVKLGGKCGALEYPTHSDRDRHKALNGENFIQSIWKQIMWTNYMDESNYSTRA